jgi:uncharacterized SAM-binding protein YcdF (DUF218 family)
MSPAVRRFLRVLRAIAGAIVTIWIVAVIAVVVAARSDQHPRSDAIVILGAAQYVGRPSPVLQARLDHGAELWRAQTAPLVIVTGGIGTGDTTSEAEVGRRYLLAAGVADSAILLERAGRTTGQSMRAVATMLRERRLQTAVLVSDPFHSLRLRILALRHGFSATTSPTRTSPISRNARTQWRYVLGETFKLPVAAVLPGQ